MESGAAGGIVASHLRAVRQATLDWLEFENPRPDEAGRDDYLFRLSMQDELTRPEMPEVLNLLRQSRQLNLPIFEGSLMDLPGLFHQELTTVLQAEDEFYAIRAANARLLEQHNNDRDQTVSES